MKSFTWVALATGLVLAATGAGAQERKNEASPLEGTWHVLREEFDGNDENTREKKLVIAADKIVIQVKSDGKETTSAEMTFKLDATRQPKTIDTSREFQGKTIRLNGIYQLDGDTLRICLAEVAEMRPREFVSPKGSKLWLLILRRSKS